MTADVTIRKLFLGNALGAVNEWKNKNEEALKLGEDAKVDRDLRARFLIADIRYPRSPAERPIHQQLLLSFLCRCLSLRFFPHC